MTLEERLHKRLWLWRKAALQHRECMEELTENEEEWYLHRAEAEVFERCADELIEDLAKRKSNDLASRVLAPHPSQSSERSLPDPF